TSDGKTVVFFNSPGSALWTIDTTRASQPVQLVPDGLFPIVTRDDQRVIFLSTRSGVQTPWIVSMEGGEPTQIVKELVAGNSMDISPDGTRLLFVTGDARNQYSLVVCDLPACTNRLNLALPTNAARVLGRFT